MSFLLNLCLQCSPHVLLLSGVGPAAHLEEMGVPTVFDLPGVGQNLREHPQIGVTLRAKEQYLTEGTEPRLQTQVEGRRRLPYLCR